jgi:hypothetical protein
MARIDALGADIAELDTKIEEMIAPSVRATAWLDEVIPYWAPPWPPPSSSPRLAPVFEVSGRKYPINLESSGPPSRPQPGINSAKHFSSCDPNCSHVRQRMGVACVLLVTQEMRSGPADQTGARDAHGMSGGGNGVNSRVIQRLTASCPCSGLSWPAVGPTGGTEYEMKSLAVAAAGAAVVGLAACSQTTAHSAAPASPGTAHAAAPASPGTSGPVAPVSCKQQYVAWERGHGKKLIAALNAVSSAGAAGDAHVLTTALKKAKSAVARAPRHPMPACADPRGYLSVLLMHVNAAAASGSSASSVRAAMAGVPKIEHELTAELRTITR